VVERRLCTIALMRHFVALSVVELLQVYYTAFTILILHSFS